MPNIMQRKEFTAIMLRERKVVYRKMKYFPDQLRQFVLFKRCKTAKIFPGLPGASRIIAEISTEIRLGKRLTVLLEWPPDRFKKNTGGVPNEQFW